MKTVFLIAIIVLADAVGDILLARGMKQIGEISTLRLHLLFAIGNRVLRNKSFLAGLVFIALTFFAFLTVLSWSDLSFVFPATSLVYVVSTVGAKFILKERVTPQRWAGILLVCLGVALTSLP
jgi:drug/metabolite transporter (DMT)-like permease